MQLTHQHLQTLYQLLASQEQEILTLQETLRQQQVQIQTMNRQIQSQTNWLTANGADAMTPVREE
jgi:hypothetical protein